MPEPTTAAVLPLPLPAAAAMAAASIVVVVGGGAGTGAEAAPAGAISGATSAATAGPALGLLDLERRNDILELGKQKRGATESERNSGRCSSC